MLRRFLGLVLAALIAFPASAAEVGSRRTLLSGGKIAPVWSCNFLTGVFCNGLTYTMSGSIPATLFDSTGKLTYSGNNLKTYSNTFTDASWTKGSSTISNANAVADPFGGTQASTITANAGYAYLQGLYSSTTGYNALSSIWVRLRSGNGALTLYNTNGTGSVAKTATSNWQQIYVAGTSGGVHTYLKLEITNSGDVLDIYQGGISFVTYETTPRSVDQVITTSAAYYAPRFDYDPSTLAPRGLLVEEARTNLKTYSNIIGGTNWNIYNTLGVATSDTTYTAPNGLQNFTKLTTSNTAKQAVYQGATVVNGSTYTLSAYVRAGTGSWIGLENSAGATSVWFNIASGTVGTVNTGSASIESIGNSIYRIKWTAVAGAVSWAFSFSVPNADNTTAQTVGQTVFVFGAQMELGSYATSYIPTVASSVTRNADVVTFAGVPLAALQGAQGTIIAQTDGFGGSNNYAALVGRDGSGNLISRNGASSTQVYTQVSGAGGVIAATLGGSGVVTSPFRGAMAFNPSTLTIAANGGTVASGAGPLVSPSAVYLGGSSTTSTYALNNHVQSVAVYNKAFPNPTLQQKSVVGAPY